jgi:hypothetical protein
MGFSRLAHLGMHFLHEGMEVDAPLFLDRETVMKEVHQHGLAASHAAPHVNALSTGCFACEQLR